MTIGAIAPALPSAVPCPVPRPGSPGGEQVVMLRHPAHGDDLERFWPSRRMDAFDEHCR